MAKRDSVFFGGVPTDPDVRAIREAYPEADLPVGMVIPYHDVAGLLGVSVNSKRFRTVTWRWRRRVEAETDSLVIGVEKGVGFKVLSASEKLDASVAKLGSAVKAARRSYSLSGRVSVTEISQEERDRLMWVQRNSAALISTANTRSKTALPSIEE
ncbi:protein of unknown function [Magnetospirillum sp. XM-1]|uniref:hypothetical protein n=1 Tax=Magnetospirillum sp. XM-1 TaxID=1663591 RepID=UPI00073DD3AE|nr:hypothetical protein [Magnetospirillum sp. XM-1]CUW38817.1 protein of unknown function [Magnetospirillum sp. XM-1]